MKCKMILPLVKVWIASKAAQIGSILSMWSRWEGWRDESRVNDTLPPSPLLACIISPSHPWQTKETEM